MRAPGFERFWEEIKRIAPQPDESIDIRFRCNMAVIYQAGVDMLFDRIPPDVTLAQLARLEDVLKSTCIAHVLALPQGHECHTHQCVEFVRDQALSQIAGMRHAIERRSLPVDQPVVPPPRRFDGIIIGEIIEPPPPPEEESEEES